LNRDAMENERGQKTYRCLGQSLGNFRQRVELRDWGAGHAIETAPRSLDNAAAQKTQEVFPRDARRLNVARAQHAVLLG
jgi:hypothetical protein